MGYGVKETGFQLRYDINGDGNGDEIREGGSLKNGCPDWQAECSSLDNYVLEPRLINRGGRVHSMKLAPAGLHNYVDEFRAYAYSGNDPQIRFYPDGGLLSFLKGQTVGVLGRNGRVGAVMKIDGFAVGFKVEKRLGKYHARIGTDQKGVVRRRAYELSKNGVRQESRLERLVWMVNIGSGYERLNPALFHQKDAEEAGLTESEKLLKPLFVKVAEYNKRHGELKTSKQKRSALLFVQRQMLLWKRHSVKKSSSMAHAIAGDKFIWEGIRLALVKAIGLPGIEISKNP